MELQRMTYESGAHSIIDGVLFDSLYFEDGVHAINPNCVATIGTRMELMYKVTGQTQRSLVFGRRYPPSHTSEAISVYWYSLVGDSREKLIDKESYLKLEAFLERVGD